MHPRWTPLLAMPLAAPLWADATLYGELHASLGRHSQSPGISQSRLDNAGSLLGVKGSEALGNGLKTIWQIELEVALDGSKTPVLSQTFVGLEDASLGTLRLGQLDSTLKRLYTVDQWRSGGSINHHVPRAGDGSTNLGADALKVFTNPGKRLKNAIGYETPQLSGLQAGIVYGFGENARPATLTSPAVERTSDIFSLGLQYQSQGWFAAYAFQREANPCGFGQTRTSRPCQAQTGGRISPASLHYLESGYRDDQWLLALAWQQARGYDWTDGLSGDSLRPHGPADRPQSAAQADLHSRQAALSLAHTRGALTPKLTLARGWDQRLGSERLPHSGYQQWIIGADYQLSRRTKAGISHGRLRFHPQAGATQAEQRSSLSSTSLSLSHKF